MVGERGFPSLRSEFIVYSYSYDLIFERVCHNEPEWIGIATEKFIISCHCWISYLPRIYSYLISRQRKDFTGVQLEAVSSVKSMSLGALRKGSTNYFWKLQIAWLQGRLLLFSELCIVGD